MNRSLKNNLRDGEFVTPTKAVPISHDTASEKSTKKAIDALIKRDPWEEIGFHRPLGSLWYSFMIYLFSAIISLFFISLVFTWLYPYPEMQGYNHVASGFFAVIYQIFDMGTAFGIQRFIAEYRIKNPKKMLEYVRFFIWYQMFTGIIQILVISIWILQYIRVNVALSYASWLFLIICQKQWPGMLGTFGSVLKGLQKYNKSQILSFVGGAVFQNFTNVIFILLGRWWGQNNPAIGDLMGGAIGFAIGAYIDDFFTMLLAARFLDKELKLLGFSISDAIVPQVGKDVIKQCMVFGFQASMVPLLNVVSETLILLMFLEHLPQYTTWIVLKKLAEGIAGAVNVGNFETTSSIAEAYGNGKKELTSFYVSNSLKWNSFLKMFLIMILIGIFPLLSEIFNSLEGLEPYASAVVFIPFLLVEQLFFAFIQISDPILVGTLHITFYTIVRLGEEVVRLLILYLLLVVFRLGTWGVLGVMLTLGYDRFYARLVKMVAALIYINKKVFKVKIYWKTSVIIPLIAALPVLAITLTLTLVVAPPLILSIGLIPTVIIGMIICVLIVPFSIFLPLVSYLGGFDDFQLETFRKSVDLSGPSKPLVKIFYKVVLWGHKKSPWKNKYRIPWEIPEREMQELMEMKANQTELHLSSNTANNNK